VGSTTPTAADVFAGYYAAIPADKKAELDQMAAARNITPMQMVQNYSAQLGLTPAAYLMEYFGLPYEVAFGINRAVVANPYSGITPRTWELEDRYISKGMANIQRGYHGALADLNTGTAGMGRAYGGATYGQMASERAYQEAMLRNEAQTKSYEEWAAQEEFLRAGAQSAADKYLIPDITHLTQDTIQLNMRQVENEIALLPLALQQRLDDFARIEWQDTQGRTLALMGLAAAMLDNPDPQLVGNLLQISAGYGQAASLAYGQQVSQGAANGAALAYLLDYWRTVGSGGVSSSTNYSGAGDPINFGGVYYEAFM